MINYIPIKENLIDYYDLFDVVALTGYKMHINIYKKWNGRKTDRRNINLEDISIELINDQIMRRLKNPRNKSIKKILRTLCNLDQERSTWALQKT